MSDARTLLKAKRAQTRIAHPYASYSSTGQLRCTVCAAPVKHWEGHLGSKGHRMAVVRAREAEEARRRAEEAEEARRRAEEAEEARRRAEDAERTSSKRRALASSDSDSDSDSDSARTKRRRTTPGPAHDAPGFPADFFSDPLRAVPVLDDDDDEDMADDGDKDMADGGDKDMADAPAQESTPLDAEWAAFRASVLVPVAQTDDGRRAVFERATVVAEPELAAPTAFAGEAEEDAEEERRRREREERELIMDRLVEEERAQEEADGRVSALRSRLERARAARAARRA
ncbi:hypothetical protein K488DRAFT_79981 [Vararia minispora EC-137]|uniref:Uncharacterized protein n=1 Tax=Vararia minispora EC-137 TaxID=1314806 RepID=A0ACB8QDM6_9AGAM|nr:hypothetical protein K488DRAFT_79981 [Vararia minispora EC-137]